MTDNVLDFVKIAKGVIQDEANALLELSSRLGDSFSKACQLVLNSSGRVILTGVGKSGLIARKIASTLSSVGVPSFFVHSAEARHGDLGMITRDDVVFAFSYSGKSEEVVHVAQILCGLGVPVVAVTKDTSSVLNDFAACSIVVGNCKEACFVGLAPTTSTALMLSIGDALAVALASANKFSKDKFACLHPGGAIGKRLTTKALDIAHRGDFIPFVFEDATITSALLEMSAKRLGMTAIISKKDRSVLGVFTDGDLRRAIDAGVDVVRAKVWDVMTRSFLSFDENGLAIDALRIMKDKKITSLVVLDSGKCAIGIVHIHDILMAGIE